MQTIEEKVDTSKALDASLVDKESSGTESKEQDTCSRSGNNTHADDADIRPIYDEEPMTEAQITAKINIFAIGQQHTEQPEFNNEGEVDKNAKKCHDTYLLLAILTDNQTPEHSYQTLESKNICLKKTVAQFQKDFSRMETHCVNLKLKYQNKVLKAGQQSQLLKEKSNEAKVKHDIDAIQTLNIKLEYKVAKLLKENKTLKKHYKEPFDSIKTTRAKTIEHTNSLIASNDNFKAQLLEKGFVIAALKKVGHRWVPTGKIFTSSTTKVDSEPLNGYADITNQYECKQNLDVSASTLNLSAVQNSEFTTTAMNRSVES
uniref:Integrase, catalytic region, zinc finger, CCHC-type, peptidase aspartic, catalytic n=1 Tax=Tanacetum cinerariifolium TaxID=118510 RepID=A0A699GGP6_TANCI|nr:hypothetical protein [Tanacetum cinerariifolium]